MANLLNIKKITENKYIKLYNLTYLNKMGKPKTYEIVSRNEIVTSDDLGKRAIGVSIVILNKEHTKILLLEEFRMSVNRTVLNFVSGLIDGNEGVESAIKREIYEEIGIEELNIIRILSPSFSAVGMSDEKVHLAFVEIDDKNLFKDNTSENEEIIPKFYTKDEIRVILETRELASKTQAVCEMWINPIS